MYLLDTNICIYAIKQKHEKLLDLIKEKSGEGLFISSLTVAELEFGVQNSQQVDRNRIAMIKFLFYFNILNFDGSDAIEYGKIKAELRKKGQIIGQIDLLLAAQAVNRKMTLITNNLKEFLRVDGLKVEDWSR
jgi:tRNA(fMet)-specific endonuclease VapC